jgi:uncharacterized membrane protein
MLNYVMNKIKYDPALRPVKALAAAGVLGIMMLLARIVYTGELLHSQLVWNLYLAWVPLFFAYILMKSGDLSNQKIKLYTLVFMWLLFFPNAPYIITDFIHVRNTTGNLLILDSILVFTFAFTGLGAGLLSLHWVYQSMKLHYPKRKAQIIMLASVILCGYGVFLGRSLRWNSWDIFTNPMPLLKDSIFHLNDKVAIAMTFLFSSLLLTGYFVFINLIRLKDGENIR